MSYKIEIADRSAYAVLAVMTLNGDMPGNNINVYVCENGFISIIRLSPAPGSAV